MERIVIRSKGGKFTVKTEGFSGPACAEATKGLERLLGVKVSDAPTPEMYQTSEQSEYQST